jgi:hypothetical protein
MHEDAISKTLQALQKNCITAVFVRNRQAALEKAAAFVPNESTLVGVGGSVTLREIGLIERLEKGRYKFINQYEEGISQEENLKRRRCSLWAAVFFTSTNAITETGWLVNVDGLGNRVAALAFGPQKVVVVAGRNKICRNLDEALERIRTVAAPKNAKRLGLKTPCVGTGFCVDCSEPSRICCVTSIIKRQKDENRMHVILVNEDLGY